MARGRGAAVGQSPPALWGRARRALLRGAVLCCGALLLLWASLFLYGAFYYASVPPAALLRPLHFAFRTDCASPGPELCSFPTANVSLLGGNREKILLYGQLYRISLELELPESPLNRRLGMFMVNLTCYGAAGRPLASAARAAMLHYRSPLLRTLHTAAFAALFLSGLAEQKQTLEIELCPQYREDPYVPTEGAVVEIQSRRLQLYSARLRVHAHFSGLRYLLYHFPLTSALLGVAGNFALLTLLLLSAYLQWLWGGRPRPSPTPPERRSEGTTREEEEGEGPSPPRDAPENLGTTESGAEAAPPPLLAAAPPPPEEEEEEEEEGGGAGGEGEGGASSPTPPRPPEGPPSPRPRPRPVCSSS